MEQESISPARARRKARLAWALLGALVLGAIGAYVALRSGGDNDPAPLWPGSANWLRAHASPRPVPDIAFEDGQGRQRTSAQFRGKVVLLNVWATWCVPCREEMPSLERLQQKLGGPGFEVVALSIDTAGAAAVHAFYDEIGIRALPIYVDATAPASASLGVVGIPTTLLVDRQGREIARRAGAAQWDGPVAVRAIQTHLAPDAKR